MPVRRAAPSSKPSPKPSGYAENEPTREALLAALAERKRELAEAHEQQAAVAEMLQVINGSPGELEAVFDTIVDKAIRFCDATGGGLWLVEGEMARAVGGRRGMLPRPFLDFIFRAPFPVAEILGRNPHERPFVHIEDLKATRAYQQRSPFTVACVELGDMRTALVVPMFEDGAVAGTFTLIRNHVLPFTEKQIALVQAFAAQALIAMKNARLINETREALERQTATAEILRVISQSPTDARPVFESIVVTAARLLRCDMAFMLLREGDAYLHTAGATPEGPMPDLAPERIPIDPNANFPSRAFLAKTMLHLPDWSQIDLPEHERRIHEMFGVNSVLYLPLLRGDECIGLLAVGGRRANIFGPSEIAQAESFRDQALIAMENARLFNETQEALERQTATAEVLKVIASSPSDVQPVFDAIATSANRLLGGFSTAVFRVADETVHLAAFTPTNSRADEAFKALFPLRLADVTDFQPFALVREGRFAEIPDTEDGPPMTRDLARLRGYRSMLFTPLMSNGAALGVISVTREDPGGFEPDDVQLLQTFADQAVIAVQNARLFNDTQEALERQTATAEVLKVIASSPSDVQPVFDAIAASANRLLGGFSTTVIRFVGDALHLVAFTPTNAVADNALEAAFPRPIADFPPFVLVRDGETQQFIDTEAISGVPPVISELARLRGYRSMLFTPLMSKDGAIGMISVTRKEPGAFAADDVKLLRTFADQAVIAIQNASLFNETQEALERQTATAEILRVISQSPTDARPVFERIVLTAARVLQCDLAFACLLYTSPSPRDCS